MSPSRCGASAFLSARGLAAVPFRLCCALAILGGREPFVCEAESVDPAAAALWPEPDSAPSSANFRTIP